jgi:predicted nucleic acid-binding protein
MRRTCPQCSRMIRLKKSREIRCKCGYEFEYRSYFKGDPQVYLVDANVLIYTIDNNPVHGKACQQLVFSHNSFQLGTTNRVLLEVKQELPCVLKVYRVKDIDQRLRELFTERTFKQASLADLSLIQAARQHPEVCGIITYDVDFKNIAAAGLVRTKEGRFFVGTADDVLRKHGFFYVREKARRNS